jgi:hypothetical protein
VAHGLVPSGWTDLVCNVVAGVGQNIIHPRMRTTHPTKVMTRMDMDLFLVVNGREREYANRYEPFQDAASPNMID